MQIEILINNNSYETWSLFFGRHLGSSRKVREAQKRPWRRSHASLTSDLEHSKVHFVTCRFFFSVHVFCGMPFNEKQTAYWKVWNLFPYVYFWSLSNHKMKTATTIAPNKRLQIARSLSFFCTFIRFCLQKKECNNQSSRFWEHKHLAM